MEAGNDCGNGVVDNDEECDCGGEHDPETKRCFNDTCCNGETCRLFDDMDIECRYMYNVINTTVKINARKYHDFVAMVLVRVLCMSIMP